MLGLILFAALNILMLQYHYDRWTNPKVGFWSAFWNKFEISGFDSYTYIVISQWRPLYVLERHPLLAAMMWPLSELNDWLKDITRINCAIHIVAVLWTIISTFSWMMMYRIQRRILELNVTNSLLLTAFFFSFSHIMLTTFTPDHMTLTLPLLLLTIYLAGKAIKENRVLPLWQSLPLLFISTGITTTNMVKIGLADLATRWGRCRFVGLVRHFLWYAMPLAIIGALYFYQKDTTQAEEQRYANNIVEKRSQRDSVFAETIARSRAARAEVRKEQIADISIVTNTEYRIDRINSLVENIFGEGLILHSDYCLKDANRHRPVLVRYNHWWYYAIEAMVVVLFLAGIWYGRRERLMLMTLSMFLFDMLLHVGLNFASVDVYIMTAHWAFVIPIAVAYLMRHTASKPRLMTGLQLLVLFLTLFMWTHNIQLTAEHLLHN